MATDISTYRFNHTMIRVKDPQVSLKFYEEILGMKLIDKMDFPEKEFTLYFLAYVRDVLPETTDEKIKYIFSREAVLELTHNWKTELDPNFEYHHGNKDPRGFGHLAIAVDNIEAACKRFDDNEVKFIKRLTDDGKDQRIINNNNLNSRKLITHLILRKLAMKNIAFIADPDGYWVEIIQIPTKT
ncbi:8632_t:CDS:2 [Funneliformis geosporum]|uniref:lactoylglutathione lyase n=1 Tax=Funneliformis geosporum TaxID=1117311 RepID=A0A9W4SGR3_9GLOM|nr:8632_t:CDS:2 [Funneliformis geosporum]CAI2169074.1 4333_t:CDS:2 [Funneliformis geosporum]